MKRWWTCSPAISLPVVSLHILKKIITMTHGLVVGPKESVAIFSKYCHQGWSFFKKRWKSNVISAALIQRLATLLCPNFMLSQMHIFSPKDLVVNTKLFKWLNLFFLAVAQARQNSNKIKWVLLVVALWKSGCCLTLPSLLHGRKAPQWGDKSQQADFVKLNLGLPQEQHDR